MGCISYYSYIKPQPNMIIKIIKIVVYRTIPTSNHNLATAAPAAPAVVYRTIPTSNHNKDCDKNFLPKLYIVLFLHQTTTKDCDKNFLPKLYIVLFLHQTTTYCHVIPISDELYIVLFLHQTTTCLSNKQYFELLYIVLFLHQTTTVYNRHDWRICCISYYSYIKPQPRMLSFILFLSCISYYSYIKPQQTLASRVRQQVVYRTIPTSNHNLIMNLIVLRRLYIVLFLHQTTTYNVDIADNQHITITFINKKWQSRK